MPNSFKLNYTGDEVNNTIDFVQECIANDYDTTISYNVGDIVIYNNRVYRCLVDTRGDGLPARWQLIKVADVAAANAPQWIPCN